MRRILVIDDTPFWRDTTADVLRLKGYEVVTASDGLEGLAILGIQGAELVILDVEMPKLQGLCFLEEIRRHDQWLQLPVIMLTGDMQKEHVLRAKALGAAEYLLKARFSVDSLMERVERRIGKMSPISSHPARTDDRVMTGPIQLESASTTPLDLCAIPPLLSTSDCISRVSQAISGRAISGVVAKVISVITSSRADTQEIASLIGKDPMLSARVLQVANSAAYASSRGCVTTIADAIRKIGCAAIRNIAATVGVFDAVPLDQTRGFNSVCWWQHSFAVALLCEQLCALSDPDRCGAAYLVGLCHDLADVLVRTGFEVEYRHIDEICMQSAKSRDEVECHLIGMTHRQLVMATLEQLGLPEAILQPIEDFHKARAGVTLNNPLALVLQLADAYANGVLLTSSGGSHLLPLTRKACTAAVGQSDPERPDDDMLRSQIFSLRALLMPSALSQSTENVIPPSIRHDVKIHIVRDKTFSSFDPIAAALSSIARVEIHQSLPKKPFDDINGLVVIDQSFTPGIISEINAFQKLQGHLDLPVLWLADSGFATTDLDSQPSPLTAASLLEFVDRAQHLRILKTA